MSELMKKVYYNPSDPASLGGKEWLKRGVSQEYGVALKVLQSYFFSNVQTCRPDPLETAHLSHTPLLLLRLYLTGAVLCNVYVSGLVSSSGYVYITHIHYVYITQNRTCQILQLFSN